MSTTSGTSTATTTQNASPSTATAPTVVPDTNSEVMSPGVYSIFIALFVIVVTIFVLFSTGSVLAVLAVWAVMAISISVLVYYGFLDLDQLLGKKTAAPRATAQPRTTAGGNPLVGSEVFHINQNQFTYDEAPAVCAAYGAQLATLEQVIEAYNSGAEWCGYGWTAGGMALYPTQKKTWTELQREVDPGKRTACGRPGVNGGYFDPTLKFGVNCFGFKPPGEFTPPAPVPGTDQQRFRDMVNRFKEMLKTMQLSPWSRNEWSGYDSTIGGRLSSATRGRETFIGGSSDSSYGTQFKQDLGKLEEGFDNVDPAYIEAANTIAMYAPEGPYGLLGPQGLVGPTGPQGPVSTVGGSTGPTGPRGQNGTNGTNGAPGAPGTNGTNGATGATGATGPAASLAGITGLEAIIAPLVRKGDYKNYTTCVGDPRTWDFAGRFKFPGDDQYLNTTRGTLCTSFYSPADWAPGDTSDKRKAQYKS